ncbi:MAG TPA: hypothetical protein VK205_05290 [Prolixibacteraceae bacterium]|nr:hypothetical protein [Prolixibacteraceae bacterium]
MTDWFLRSPPPYSYRKGLYGGINGMNELRKGMEGLVGLEWQGAWSMEQGAWFKGLEG